MVHFDLPGRLPIGHSNLTSEAVMLHLFVKGIRAGNSVTLRGIGFALSLDREVQHTSCLLPG